MPLPVMVLGWGLVPGPGTGWMDLAWLPGALGLVPSLQTCLSSLSISEFTVVQNSLQCSGRTCSGLFWGSVFLGSTGDAALPIRTLQFGLCQGTP